MIVFYWHSEQPAFSHHIIFSGAVALWMAALHHSSGKGLTFSPATSMLTIASLSFLQLKGFCEKAPQFLMILAACAGHLVDMWGFSSRLFCFYQKP